MSRARIAVALVIALAGLALVGAAQAEGPAESGTSIEALPTQKPPAGQESIVLAARLTDEGSAVAGVPVTFYVVTDVFGERLMQVGDALSDATGTASILFEPTWEGEVTAVARFAGNADHAAAQTSFEFESEEAVSLWEPAEFGLDPVRRWLPVGVAIVIFAVWGVLGYALATAVLGIPAAAEHTTATQPLPPWDSRIRRPAPLGPLLGGIAVLLVIAAIPTALLIGREQAPDDPAPWQDPNFDAGHGDHPATAPLAASLVRAVEVTRFDELGQPEPESVALPADIAVTEGRVRVLDAIRGHIVTVTEDGRLALILDALRYGDISLTGATAMATHDDMMYVAAQDGRIIIVNSAGKIEQAITPVLPAGELPPTPAGIAIGDYGDIWLSDAGNHRVLLLDNRGVFQVVLGTGVASADSEGFNTPAGLTTDNNGNLYVADSGNGLVKKFSPMGVLLETFGEGALVTPTAVAVSETGTIFVSDEGAKLVSAFAANGTYLGSIGEGQLESPHSVKVEGDLLYVMDRLAGLFVYQPETTTASEP
ncbi:MAG TPA: hypothetical protein VFP63_00895 [Dehalococcoidia bacterium]|nr:hypothetical protein [Dehalococcoidia bacterium]